MKPIIKHVFYKTQCQFCGTEFAFEKSDIYNQVTADKKKIMPFTECPQCGKRTPANTNEQTEIKDQKRLSDNKVTEIAKLSAQLTVYQNVLFAIAQAIRDKKPAKEYTKNIIVTPLDNGDKHLINDIIEFIDQQQKLDTEQ